MLAAQFAWIGLVGNWIDIALLQYKLEYFSIPLAYIVCTLFQ